MTAPRDPESEALRILIMARKDLQALEGMLDASVFSEEIFGFHVEQATEKLLKAWISALGLEYPRTHDLGRLLRLLSDQGLDMVLYTGLAMFTPFGVQFRYEAYDDLADSPIDRAQAISTVRLLFERVEAVV